ncbi:MAG TPA: hypothetical protein VFP67_00435 [Acidimicrobiia bacterium]|nr:hypothetical protein [Acidimicrobiia bacterium]
MTVDLPPVRRNVKRSMGGNILALIRDTTGVDATEMTHRRIGPGAGFPYPRSAASPTGDKIRQRRR